MLPTSQGSGGSGSSLPARTGDDYADAVSDRWAGEIAKVEASEHYDGYLDAIEDLALGIGATISKGQALVIALRLAKNGATAEEARLIAEILTDDAEYVRGIVRYNAPVVAADWIAVLRRLPRPGRRYGLAEIESFAVLGFERECFRKAGDEERDPKPYVYVGKPAVSGLTEGGSDARS